MSLKTAVRTNTILKKIAQGIEKKARRGVISLMWKCIKKPNDIDANNLHGPMKILLVRPNYRIGNALIMSPVIDMFRRRFPEAQLDFLTTDNTQALLRNQPVDRFFTLSRRAILRPWLFIGLLHRLRQERYDLAVQVGPSSLTGFIFVRFIGSRYTMGKGKRDQRWFDIELKGEQKHAYDLSAMFARALGTPGRDRPSMILSDGERSIGRGELEELSITFDVQGQAAPFVAVFVGGHLDKRFPLSFWHQIIERLEQAGQRHMVFLGPEEVRHASALTDQLAQGRHGMLCHPKPLRTFAAMVSHACCLISPDSGPMHMGAALDVPVITLVQKRKSMKFVPRGHRDITLWQPRPDEVINAVTASNGVSLLAPPEPLTAAKDRAPVLS